MPNASFNFEGSALGGVKTFKRIANGRTDSTSRDQALLSAFRLSMRKSFKILKVSLKLFYYPAFYLFLKEIKRGKTSRRAVKESTRDTLIKTNRYYKM